MSKAAQARRLRGLREEVRRFASALGTTRAGPTIAHVGHLGGDRVSMAHDPDLDAALRADLVGRALEGLASLREIATWVTRTGDLAPVTADHQWYAASRLAVARHGLPAVSHYALTRRSWLDLETGQWHEWRRLRPYSTG